MGAFSATSPLRRYVAPLAAAAVVAAVASCAAVLLGHRGDLASSAAVHLRHSAPAPTPSGRAAIVTVRQPADPREAAVRTAEMVLVAAPMVPGATMVDSPPLAVLNEPGLGVTGAQHVQRTRFWTAPGTVAAMISYLQAHRPAGMRTSGSGSSTGPGVPTNRFLGFQADAFRSLQYTVVAYRAGVAVRADAVVLWAPRRSPDDTVPASVTAVDVLVVRHNPQLHQGAPTVHRVLAGRVARALADFVNRLPRAVPIRVPHSCPLELQSERWFDRLLFHSAGPDVAVVVDMAGCASIEFRAGHRTRIQLGADPGGVDIDEMIDRSVGLPGSYGR